jgi:hypothetical protein
MEDAKQNDMIRLQAFAGPAKTVANELANYGNETIVTIVLRGPVSETMSLAEAIHSFGPLEPLFMGGKGERRAISVLSDHGSEPVTDDGQKKVATSSVLNSPKLSDWQWD